MTEDELLEPTVKKQRKDDTLGKSVNHEIFSDSQIIITARPARFSKKSLWPDVGEITKMSVKFEKNTAKCPRKIEHGDLL